MKSSKNNIVTNKAAVTTHISTKGHSDSFKNEAVNSVKEKSSIGIARNESKSEMKNDMKGKLKLGSIKKREVGATNLKVSIKETVMSARGKDKDKERDKEGDKERDKDKDKERDKDKDKERDKDKDKEGDKEKDKEGDKEKDKEHDKDKMVTPKSSRKERHANQRKKGVNAAINSATNALSTNRESARLQNSPKRCIEDNRKDKETEKNSTKKKTWKTGKITHKTDIPLSAKNYKGKLKMKSFWKGEAKKLTENHRRIKRSKSCFNATNSKTHLQQTHIRFSDASDGESNLEKISVEDNVDIEKQKKETTEKVLKKYKELFDKYKETVVGIIKGDTSSSLNTDYTRSVLNHLLKISWRCLDFNLSISCAILLLLDRLNNPETELTENEKENIENIIRSYGNKAFSSYKYIFKMQHKKSNKGEVEKDKDKNKNKNKIKIENAKGMKDVEQTEKEEKKKQKEEKMKEKNKSEAEKQEGEGGEEKEGEKAEENLKEENEMKKKISDHLRIKMKNIFLLNFEVFINLINCILYTIEQEEQKVYFLHLRGQLYKLISDITETAIKYKYEQLAQESYEQALVIANKYFPPTNLCYLNLVYNYIYFLYFVIGEEEEALDLSKDAFGKATDQLEQIENEENVEKCLQILSRMRYNIKRWSYKLHKDMLLFLKF